MPLWYIGAEQIIARMRTLRSGRSTRISMRSRSTTSVVSERRAHYEQRHAERAAQLLRREEPTGRCHHGGVPDGVCRHGHRRRTPSSSVKASRTSTTLRIIGAHEAGHADDERRWLAGLERRCGCGREACAPGCVRYRDDGRWHVHVHHSFVGALDGEALPARRSCRWSTTTGLARAALFRGGRASRGPCQPGRMTSPSASSRRRTTAASPRQPAVRTREKIQRVDEVIPAIERAVRAVREEGRCAVIDASV